MKIDASGQIAPYRIHYAWIVLIISVFTVTVALGFARFGYTVIFPQMKAGLNLTAIQAGDLAAGNLAGYLVLTLFCGFLASKFGPRFVIGISLGVVALSMFLTGFAPDYLTALLSRIFTGMGSGGANVTVMGLLSSWYAAKKRGFAAGIAAGGSSLGIMITGICFPVLFRHYPETGFRLAWFFIAGITLVIAAVCLVFLRNSPAEKGLQQIGTEKEEKAKPAEKISGLAWGLVYRSKSIWHLALIYLLFGFSYIIYATFYVQYLVAEAGIDTGTASWLWFMVGAFSIISGLIWGLVSDRLGRKNALIIVFSLQSLCFFIFGAEKIMAGYIISSILFALTAWSIPSIMAAAAGDAVSDASGGTRLAPAALGFITFFFGIGQVVGPFLAGRIAEISGSYATAFILAGIAAAAGAVFSLFISRVMTKSKETAP